ncbi:hypothetical protein [Solirubrobacter soli]|uniref:hypothetical protein n=1 Tax=Solirubrobacter soli TaxID=363832 RepID=UPI0003FF8792|nr:hypothetical protein [Solirubrobacter soli]
MDIFVRAFGDVADRDGIPVRRILLEAGGFRVAGDGSLDVAGTSVHGLPIAGRPFAGLKFAHVTDAVFELIVHVARTADMVILPVGCPLCVVFEHQRAQLPEDMASHDVQLVETGEELAIVVRGALPSSG